MKKYLFLVFLSLILVFTACEPEVIELPIQPETPIEVTIFHQWKLVDGEMFFVNLETSEKTMLKHFGPGREVSSLRYSGIYLPIERIEIGENATTWKFIMPPAGVGQGEFILNGSETPMGFQVSHSYMSITEHPTATEIVEQQLGGSARPITAYTLSSDTIIIQIHNAYESIDGYNYTYFSELKFVLDE